VGVLLFIQQLFNFILIMVTLKPQHQKSTQLKTSVVENLTRNFLAKYPVPKRSTDLHKLKVEMFVQR
jgi:hypothetical protein